MLLFRSSMSRMDLECTLVHSAWYAKACWIACSRQKTGPGPKRKRFSTSWPNCLRACRRSLPRLMPQHKQVEFRERDVLWEAKHL